MGAVHEAIDDRLAAWIVEQPMFFVATAPRDGAGHVNCSPKGLPGTFAVLGPHEVAYLDLTGSGAETLAHLRDDGRIVIMLCAFQGSPRIVRLHGRGRALLPGDPGFDALQARFASYVGTRAIICVDVDRVSDSCGFGVPQMGDPVDRDVLVRDHERRGAQGLADYRHRMNAVSIDGLPALPTPTSDS